MRKVVGTFIVLALLGGAIGFGMLWHKHTLDAERAEYHRMVQRQAHLRSTGSDELDRAEVIELQKRIAAYRADHPDEAE